MLLLQVRSSFIVELYTKTNRTSRLALLLYEYAITLDAEIQFIWRDVRAGYAALFMINRLNMVCMFVVMLGGTISLDDIVVGSRCLYALAHCTHSLLQGCDRLL